MEIFKLYGSVLIDTSKAMTSMQKLVGEADKVGTKLGNSFKTFGNNETKENTTTLKTAENAE